MEAFYNQIIDKKRVDIPNENKNSIKSGAEQDYQMIDINSLKNKDVKEIGAEWMT